jgi:hypothetical protein
MEIHLLINDTGFNFTGVEQVNREVRNSLPDTPDKGGESFAIYPRVGVGIEENAVLIRSFQSSPSRITDQYPLI